MKSYEVNFDGLVGLTHNYSGLSVGNMASMSHKAQSSKPKAAALQGLEKMKFLMDLGLKQAVLPPHARPHIPTLKRLGFYGTDAEILTKVAQDLPHILNNCSSSSAMWTANAATVSPSIDCDDNRVHLTPANLTNKFHRSIELKTTQKILQTIFHDEKYYAVHDPLPSVVAFGDEGAANHTRLCTDYNSKGLELFAFGKYTLVSGKPKPRFFPARQSFEASQAIARLHKLNNENTLFTQQSPLAIDAGVFHNDVISVGNQNVLLYHEQAFFDCDTVIKNIKESFSKLCNSELCVIGVSGHEVTVQEAVQTYLFNSQLITLPDGTMAFIAPYESQKNKVVKRCIERIIGDKKNPIKNVYFLNVRESMLNGGGPACLRLRVLLNESEINSIKPKVFLDNNLYKSLYTWINKHYREELNYTDLADPSLLNETYTALDQLTQILGLGSIYDFQISSL